MIRSIEDLEARTAQIPSNLSLSEIKTFIPEVEFFIDRLYPLFYEEILDSVKDSDSVKAQIRHLEIVEEQCEFGRNLIREIRNQLDFSQFRFKETKQLAQNIKASISQSSFEI